MLFDNTLGYRHAQPGPLWLRGEKRLEDAFQVLRGDPRSLVFYGNPHGISIAGSTESDLHASRRGIESVLEDVYQCLAHPLPIKPHPF